MWREFENEAGDSAHVEDAHGLWRRAAEEAGSALHSWFAADAASRPTAYVVYCAALDREAAAARELERQTRTAVVAEVPQLA